MVRRLLEPVLGRVQSKRMRQTSSGRSGECGRAWVVWGQREMGSGEAGGVLNERWLGGWRAACVECAEQVLLRR